MFCVLKSLSCDIFPGAHGSYFDLETKYARLKESAFLPKGHRKPPVFIAPEMKSLRIDQKVTKGDFHSWRGNCSIKDDAIDFLHHSGERP